MSGIVRVGERAFVVTEIVPVFSNPKPGLRRDRTRPAGRPIVHPFVVEEIVCWRRGFPFRRLLNSPAGFLEVTP